MACLFLGELSWWVAGCSLPSPAAWGLLSSAPAALTELTLAARGETRVLLGPSARSHSRALGCSAFLLVSANAARKQLGCRGATSPRPLLPLSKAGAWYCLQNQTPVVLAWRSWDVGLGLPLPRADSKAQPALAKLAGSRVVSPLLLRQKAEFLLILMEKPFTPGEQHLLLHPTTPFPSPVRSEPCVVASPAFPWRQTLTSQAWAIAPGTVISLYLWSYAGLELGREISPNLASPESWRSCADESGPAASPVPETQPQPLGTSARRFFLSAVLPAFRCRCLLYW